MDIASFVTNLSWCELYWVVGTVVIAGPGWIYLAFPNLSDFLANMLLFGKMRSKNTDSFNRKIEVPKSWFKHFYLIASSYACLSLFFLLAAYLGISSPPPWLRSLLEFLSAPRSGVSVDQFTVTLTLVLYWLHAFRRAIESNFISIYSDSKMNALHYFAGATFYIFVPMSLLSEAPCFGMSESDECEEMVPRFPGLIQIFGIVLFFYFSFHQFISCVIFAQLRMDKQGKVASTNYSIPKGDLFEYVTSPHYLCEIGIYISLFMCLNFEHRLWAFIVTFVLNNQVISAIVAHRWYHEKYKSEYPKNRKILIPFVL